MIRDQREIAAAALNVLKQAATFEHLELIGSVAAANHDDMSDIDILIRDGRRSPRANVELAVKLLEREFGSLLVDWAGDLLPEKCLISIFLPNQPLFWYIDVGCNADSNHHDLYRDEIVETRDAHLAKLLIMNAKHYLRANQTRLRIDELYRKVVSDGQEATTSGKFKAVFDAINYSKLEPQLFTKSREIITQIEQP